MKAGELGCSKAYCGLGDAYYKGIGVYVDKDRKRAEHYWELAAIAGDETARHNLGCVEEMMLH